MKKLFIEPADKESLVDGQMYYLFDICGYMVGLGNWEEDNQCFYDNNEDETYRLNDADFIMVRPTIEQMTSL